MLRKFLRGYFHLFHFTRFTGRENLPPPGAALLAANHASYYDPILVAAGQDLPVRFMAWDELFEAPLFAKIISDWGAFPVNTKGDDIAGFRTCLDLLKKGERVVIFPEGGRSEGAGMLPLHEGVARLAIRSGAPIAPVRITGADRAWPRWEFAPRPFFRIDVHFCPVIRVRPARGLEERREESTRIMAELRQAIDPMLEH